MGGQPPDVFDPRVFARGVPHEAFRRLRDTDPVCWQPEPEVLGWPPGPGYWAVTRYADVRHVLRRPELFSSWLGATQIRDPEAGDLDFIRRMILNMDPPEHGRLRRIAAAAFTRRRLERVAGRMASRGRALLAEAAARGRCDLPADVTDDFPLANLADLLGVPAADRPLLLRWTNRVIGYQDPEHAGVIRNAGGRPVNPPLTRRAGRHVRLRQGTRRRQAPAPGRRPDDRAGRRLGGRQVAGRCRAGHVLPAGDRRQRHGPQRAARRGAPGGVLALAQHPGVYARLRADPGLLPAAIEEMLRWHPPVLSFRRTATGDTELAGQPIRRGDTASSP